MPQAADIADLVTGTLRNLGPPAWTDNSSKYTRTLATKILIKKSKVEFLNNGYEVQFNRMTATSNSFRFVPMGAHDEVDITNQMSQGTVPWRHASWNFALEFREPLMNRGRAEIFNLIKSRRIASMGSMIEGFERALWRVGGPSTNDINGVPYWIVKSNTTANVTNNDGLNGLTPAGYTTVGGFNPTTDDKWRNFATQYSIVSKDDFVRKARLMAENTGFEPLVEDTPTYDNGEKTLFYSNYNLVAALVEILESQNENLGMDIAPYEGKTMFMNTPVMIVPELRNDTTNPFYQIAWSEFFVKGLSGAWMKEFDVPIMPGQHTVSAKFYDTSLNTVCVDRRRQGVLATDTTMPA